MVRNFAGLAAAAGLVATVACGQTDAGITTSVKNRLAADDTVKAYQVNVDTRNHVVTLSGDVETAAAKDRAIIIARETDGVRDVIDQLRVDETAATSGISEPASDPAVQVGVNDGVERKAGRAADATKNTAEKIGDATVEGAKKAGEGARKAGEATVEGARKAGEATAEGAKKVGEATAEGAKKVGGEVRDAVTDDDHDSDKDGK